MKGDGHNLGSLFSCRMSGVFLFSVSGGPSLTNTQYISLPYVPLDVDFEDSASLWVLSGVKENPIELHRYNNSAWQVSDVQM